MSDAIELSLDLDEGTLDYREVGDETWWNIKELDSKAFAALCEAVKREWSRRQREKK